MAPPKTPTGYKPQVRFHLSHRFQNHAKKARHPVGDEVPTLKVVLRGNPEYGKVVRATGGLRKMRVGITSLNFGKSGGYRLIYCAKTIDEVIYIVLAEIYFKGDLEDLDRATYKAIVKDVAAIFANAIDYDWE